jgi:hypothetical protein
LVNNDAIMKRLLFIILLFIPCFVFGQNKISGVVLDSLTQKPLPFATVYVNGTTKGTTTDVNGFFNLDNITLPSTVVFSFLGYLPKAKYIIDSSSELLIELQTNVRELSEVNITDMNFREENVRTFEKMFLGEDDWGKNAIIKNDSVLMFDLAYNDKKVFVNDKIMNYIKRGVYENISEWNEDSLYYITQELSTFKAYALEPLVIDLPLLGYKLNVDLVDFTIRYIGNEAQCDILGYFYYQPYKTDSKSKLKKYNKNRRLAYYNSSQHFLRSLYDDKLEQNGYKLAEAKTSTSLNIQRLVGDALGGAGGKLAESVNSAMSQGITRFNNIQIDSYTKKTENNEMQISGLSDSKVLVLYYYKSDGSPLNLENNKTSNPYYLSEIRFLKDTCTFTKEGIVPDNSIIFMGEISKKRVAACLPDDYIIDND